MRRWKLLLTTLPIVAGVFALVYLRTDVLELDSLLTFADLAPIITGVALLLGLMLAGVLADYKESEKLPALLASTLMGIEDNLAAALEAGKAVDKDRVRALHASVTTTITEWFLNRASLDTCLTSINNINTIIGTFDKAGATAYIVPLSTSRQSLRGTVTRVETIRTTEFMPVGYVLLYLLVGITVLMLVFAGFKDTAVQYLVVGSVTLVYVYVIRLIGDIDNPFDYLPSGGARGSAEVDPTPLREYCKTVQGA